MIKAILCENLSDDPKLVVANIPAPVPASDEVVIQVELVAINYFDTLIIRGKYQLRPPLPFSPGGECVGTIIALGSEVEDLNLGEKVYAYTNVNSCREQVAVKAAHVVPLVREIKSEQAVCLGITYGTAQYALHHRTHLRMGERLCVLGASGGVGIAAVELGADIGAEVIACASSEEKLEMCRSRGATHLVNYNQGNLKAKLKSLGGCDVIFDAVGGVYSEPTLRSLNSEGRHLVVGFSGNTIPAIPLNLALLKNVSIIGVNFAHFINNHTPLIRKDMVNLMNKAVAGTIRPHVDSIFSLSQTAEAIETLRQRKVIGKILVRVQ